MCSYRRIYEQHYGPIPTDEDGRTYDVHHIDGNGSNDDPQNLVALSIQEHYNVHERQGDFAACQRIALRMRVSPEEKSRLATLANLQRSSMGTNPFQNSELHSKVSLQMVADGTHPFLDKEAARQRANERMADKTHNFLTDPPMKGKHWFNDGVINRCCKEHPGGGWFEGILLTYKKPLNTLFWNDGVVNKRSLECPGEGFVKGRMKHVPIT